MYARAFVNYALYFLLLLYNKHKPFQLNCVIFVFIIKQVYEESMLHILQCNGLALRNRFIFADRR